MDEFQNSDIAEVVEAGNRAANAYLEAGYVLLRVDSHTRLMERTPSQGNTSWVRRSIIYVLGRPSDVGAIERPENRREATA
jgi:hypothetical protein